MSRRILYLSFNDGSDMRVSKEVRTLSREAAITLVALGPDSAQCYAADCVQGLHFITGNRKSGSTLLRYFFSSARLLLTRRYDSVHIINEPQLLVLWPFLWGQKAVILDIFDSIFLRRNRPGNRWFWLKKLVYAPISRTIVTDENRLGLLPDFLRRQAVVVPNYPYFLPVLPAKKRLPHLTLMYYGWLGDQRGTETVRQLLASDPTTRIIMAGWLADESSQALTQHPRVEWLGVLPQAEAMHVAAARADYILCVYAPSNDNNINASPNKIFDAIQTRTPVIINAEVKIAKFVEQVKIGCILPRYHPHDYGALARELFRKRESYKVSEESRQHYTWQNIESTLYHVHGLSTTS